MAYGDSTTQVRLPFWFTEMDDPCNDRTVCFGEEIIEKGAESETELYKMEKFFSNPYSSVSKMRRECK